MDRRLSNRDLYLLAAASAVVTANAYYIHPIIARVGEHFEISDALIGMVPAMNQIALALGILLLLPLGDWMSNRRLVTIFACGQFIAIAGMALSDNYALFVAGSTLLGFFTIAPYLLPSYVSKRVAPQQLGHATAILTTGIIAGILVARAGAGVVGEYFGWRTVYIIASALMLLVTLCLPMIMDVSDADEQREPTQSYFGLLATLPGLMRAYPGVLLSGSIQALSFGIFLSIWMGLGLHLTSPEMGYGVDVVGYLAMFSIINLMTTPGLGRWVDKIGPRRARLCLAMFQIVGVSLFFFVGHSLWLLTIPIVITNICGPVIDITGRTMFLSEAPNIRTRLMTVYIILMFLGGGIASWAGTAAYDWAGWQGNAVLAFFLSTLVLTLSAVGLRSKKRA